MSAKDLDFKKKFNHKLDKINAVFNDSLIELFFASLENEAYFFADELLWENEKLHKYEGYHVVLLLIHKALDYEQYTEEHRDKICDLLSCIVKKYHLDIKDMIYKYGIDYIGNEDEQQDLLCLVRELNHVVRYKKNNKKILEIFKIEPDSWNEDYKRF